jgi:hypothetical protein
MLLALMLASYLAPIGFVYYKYTAAASGARSISSIITSCEPLFSCENYTGGGAATRNNNARHYYKSDTSSQPVCLSWLYLQYYMKSSEICGL